MASGTDIEWADNTHNLWWGCVKVSPACTNCYADAFDHRLGGEHWGPRARRKFQSDKYWRQPELWNARVERTGKRETVFCGSMCDWAEIVGPEHPDRDMMNLQRLRLWSLIERTPYLDWLLLSKRPENFHLLPWMMPDYERGAGPRAPWPNVWVGVTAENQEWADRRLPLLLATPAAKRFISYEPALGPLDLAKHMVGSMARKILIDGGADLGRVPAHLKPPPAIDWVIAGAERTAEKKRRRLELDWVRAVRDQCAAAGVAFFFKQQIEDGGNKVSLPVLDGRRHAEFPR